MSFPGFLFGTQGVFCVFYYMDSFKRFENLLTEKTGLYKPIF
jgi:hypothetical protein